MPVTRYRGAAAAQTYISQLAAVYRTVGAIWDPDYASGEDVEVWEKLRRDPKIEAWSQKRRWSVAGSDWQLEPPRGATDDEKKLASILQALLEELELFADARFQLASADFLGTAYAWAQGRWVYRRGGHQPLGWWWVTERLAPLDKRRIRFYVNDDGNVVRQLYSLARRQWEDLAADAPLVIVRHDADEASLGYGRGLISAIYFFHYAKTKVLQEGLRGCERWAQGVVRAAIDGLRQGSKINSALATEYQDALKQLAGEGVLVHDSRDQVETLRGGGEGWQVVPELLRYLDEAIQQLILSSVLPGGSGQEEGSYARAKVEQGEEDDLLAAARRQQAQALRAVPIGLLAKVNRANLVDLGLGDARLPAFKLHRDDTVEPDKEVERAVKALSGGIPLRRQEVYERIGYTAPQPGDDVIEPPKPQQPPPLGLREERRPWETFAAALARKADVVPPAIHNHLNVAKATLDVASARVVVPQQKPPIVHVHERPIPETRIDVAAPAVHVAAPPAITPMINVAIDKVEARKATISAAVKLSPRINIKVPPEIQAILPPPRPLSLSVERDADGKIVNVREVAR